MYCLVVLCVNLLVLCCFASVFEWRVGVGTAGVAADVFCVCFVVGCLFTLICVCYCCMVIPCGLLGWGSC